MRFSITNFNQSVSDHARSVRAKHFILGLCQVKSKGPDAVPNPYPYPDQIKFKLKVKVKVKAKVKVKVKVEVKV